MTTFLVKLIVLNFNSSTHYVKLSGGSFSQIVFSVHVCRLIFVSSQICTLSSSHFYIFCVSSYILIFLFSYLYLPHLIFLSSNSHIFCVSSYIWIFLSSYLFPILYFYLLILIFVSSKTYILSSHSHICIFTFSYFFCVSSYICIFPFSYGIHTKWRPHQYVGRHKCCNDYATGWQSTKTTMEGGSENKVFGKTNQFQSIKQVSSNLVFANVIRCIVWQDQMRWIFCKQIV